MGKSRFSTTSWTLVQLANDSAEPDGAAALASLCEAYWQPVYAFVRRSGHEPETARDLTQAFFARLIEKRILRSARPERGRFRSFLLASVRNFLINEFDRTMALKRGGAHTLVSLDVDGLEERLANELADHNNPEVLYERQWALALLERTIARLASEFHGTAQEARFRHLKGFLTGDHTASYGDAAQALGMSADAVRVAVHRLRGRYGELLRDEVARDRQLR